MKSRIPAESVAILSCIAMLLFFATLIADAQKRNEATPSQRRADLAKASPLEGSIKGKVKRKPEGGALAGATVTLRETGIATTTDGDGNYGFDSVTANNYNLDVSKTLYIPETTSVSVKAHQSSEAPLVSLARKARNLQVVVDLKHMYQAGDSAAFRREIDSLSHECRGVGDKDCKLIRQIDFESGRGNEDKTMTKLGELLKFVEKNNKEGEGKPESPKN